MVNINIQKKDLWLLSAIMVFLVGVAFVIAYGSGDSTVHGHDAGEVEGAGFNWGDKCSFQTQTGAGTLSCAADEYLVETFVDDYGDGADFSVNYGYGGSLVSVDHAASSSGILCCKDG